MSRAGALALRLALPPPGGPRAVALNPSGAPGACLWPAGFGASPLGEWQRTQVLPRLHRLRPGHCPEWASRHSRHRAGLLCPSASLARPTPGGGCPPRLPGPSLPGILLR